MHRHGCRRWFNLLRDTVSHRIIAAYRIGERPPPGDGSGRSGEQRQSS
jgi:sarcosine oxidase subunit delta